MKNTISRKTYLAMYRLLDKVSPINGDCGKLCGAICCTCGSTCSEYIVQQKGFDLNDSNDFPEDFKDDLYEEYEELSEEVEMGIYLLPGEDRIFTKKEDWLTFERDKVKDYDFPPSWKGHIYFINCDNPPFCDREKRPLQCRFYPLAPHITENNELILIWSPEEVPYVCPLIEDKMELTESFMKATYTVCKHLIRDPQIYDLYKYDSQNREDVVQVYPKPE